MTDRLATRRSARNAANRRWPRRAAQFDQGMWILLVLGILLIAAGVLGLFLGLDSAPTAVSVASGAALCGLAAVLFALASPRYVGTASMLAETLFDYTDAKARLSAFELPDHLREPFRLLARGEAAQSYLEVVLRDLEAAQAGHASDETGRTLPTPVTPALDADRIAADAVQRAREALVATVPGPDRREVDPSLENNPTRASLVRGDTVDQPLPPTQG